ncbi:MAG: mycofactocin precursor [Acidimicrobiia bacterium]|nr:mycofactocin precursor [Acidimicrobiia bacterium]
MSRTTELDPKATPAAGTAAPGGAAVADSGGESDLDGEEMLIEEISIDGMCGVY